MFWLEEAESDEALASRTVELFGSVNEDYIFFFRVYEVLDHHPNVD